MALHQSYKNVTWASQRSFLGVKRMSHGCFNGVTCRSAIKGVTCQDLRVRCDKSKVISQDLQVRSEKSREISEELQHKSVMSIVNSCD